MKAAELFIRCLENEGVEYIFGIPGEENLDVMDALLDSSINFITVRHEQGAAFMADVYGRLTGRAGVCLATLGPGATNLITGVADANLDHAPAVAIAGQAGTTRLHKESHQVRDLGKLFSPVTKYAASLLEPPLRLSLWDQVFKRFFFWVWISVITILLTGYYMMFVYFGGFAGSGLHIHLMHGLGLVMMAIYMHVFFAPYNRLKRLVAEQNYPEAARNLNLIRKLVAINTTIGLIVFVVAKSVLI